MSIDGQVLVIAFLALAFKLFVWARETDGGGVKDDLDENDMIQLDVRPLQLRARPTQADPSTLSLRLQISEEISESHV